MPPVSLHAANRPLQFQGLNIYAPVTKDGKRCYSPAYPFPYLMLTPTDTVKVVYDYDREPVVLDLKKVPAFKKLANDVARETQALYRKLQGSLGSKTEEAPMLKSLQGRFEAVAAKQGLGPDSQKFLAERMEAVLRDWFYKVFHTEVVEELRKPLTRIIDLLPVARVPGLVQQEPAPSEALSPQLASLNGTRKRSGSRKAAASVETGQPDPVLDPEAKASLLNKLAGPNVHLSLHEEWSRSFDESGFMIRLR